jgi:hypothetical protein
MARITCCIRAAPPWHRRDSGQCRFFHCHGGVPCAAFVGTLTGKTCLLGYSQVKAEAACQSLAAIAGKSYGGSVNLTSFPPDCFWFNVDGGVYLNTYATGAAHPNAQQLCAGGAPAPPSHAQPRPRCARHADTRTHTKPSTLRPAMTHVGTRALRLIAVTTLPL